MNTSTNQESGLLHLENYGAAFGEKVVLAEVNLDIPDRGVFVLLGPGGTGKSTLLRSLVGLNEANPSFRTWGKASYCGDPLGEGNRPSIISQSASLMMATVLQNVVHNIPERHTLDLSQQRELAIRLLEQAGLHHLVDKLQENVVSLSLAEQRHLAILRMAAASPRLLCLDEPTTGLESDSADKLLEYIQKESQRRAVLIVLHNLSQAKKLGGYTALLAGGHIQEVQSTQNFIEHPQSAPAKQWVKSGSCHVPLAGTPAEELADDVPPPPPLPDVARMAPSESFGPRGFLWLKRGQLAGTPLPGVFHDIDYDMKMLKRVGVTTLMTLTSRPLDTQVMQQFSVHSIWQAIPDMGAPGLEQAEKICRDINQAINQGEVIAVHCRAGLGRTGTVLAAYLIWEGAGALDALETVRGVEPRWVQSETQVAFLQNFAEYVSEHKSQPQTTQMNLNEKTFR